MHIVKEKRFYINLLTITIPIALQNLISFATSMMDTIMLGRADDTGVFLSASSLANQPFFILSLVCFGLAGASTVLSAQYWGKRDTASIRSICHFNTYGTCGTYISASRDGDIFKQ